jgi:hypothetical protein
MRFWRHYPYLGTEIYRHVLGQSGWFRLPNSEACSDHSIIRKCFPLAFSGIGPGRHLSGLLWAGGYQIQVDTRRWDKLPSVFRTSSQ